MSVLELAAEPDLVRVCLFPAFHQKVSAMSRDFKESDWKLLRKLQPIALERHCQRILAEIQYLASDREHTYHERYLAVYEAINNRNKEVAEAFDALSRSRSAIETSQDEIARARD